MEGLAKIQNPKSINRKRGRALRNSPVGYFSEGARLQGWSGLILLCVSRGAIIVPLSLYAFTPLRRYIFTIFTNI